MTTPTTPAKAASETTVEMDAETIVRGWEERARQRPQRHAVISWGARSDIGRVRENNEDKFDFFLPDDPAALADKGRLWAVADGMGGHNAGQVASEVALKALVRAYFTRASESAADGLRGAFEVANSLIFRAAQQFPDKAGMGTTLTAAVVREDVLTLLHIGDSRAYLLRGGAVRQITEDHSWVEEQVKRGGLSREQAEASPYRNIITRSVGMAAGVEADIVTQTLEAGDVVLLCSDGLSGYLDGAALIPPLQNGGSPSGAALALVDAANEAGGKDNITALVLAVRRIAPFDDVFPVEDTPEKRGKEAGDGRA